MWKVSWLYEKVHNIANLGGYAAILFVDCLQITGIVSRLVSVLYVTGFVERYLFHKFDISAN